MVSDKETAKNYINLMKNRALHDGTPMTDTRAYPGFDVLLPANASQKYSGSEKFGAMGLGFLIAGPIGAGVGAMLTGGSKDNYVYKNVMFSDEGLILVDNKNTSSVLLFPWSEFRGLNFHNSVWGPRECSIELYLNDNNVIHMKFYSPTIDEFPELFANECQKMIGGIKSPYLEEKNEPQKKEKKLSNMEKSEKNESNKEVELQNIGRYGYLEYYDKDLKDVPNQKNSQDTQNSPKNSNQQTIKDKNQTIQKTKEKNNTHNLVNKFCSQCGNELKKEDIFCSKCGKKLSEKVNETKNPNKSLEKVDIGEELKEKEIRRLVEAHSKTFIISTKLEPATGLLNDDEILKYAPKSIAAEKIRARKEGKRDDDLSVMFRRIFSLK